MKKKVFKKRPSLKIKIFQKAQISFCFILLVCLIPAININTAYSPLSGLDSPSNAASWYVSPTGNASGSGTITSPWDLQTALYRANNTILPGDTIFLRNGTYRGLFTSTLNGSSENFITVRSFANERVIIDGQITHNGGGRTIYRDLEITRDYDYYQSNNNSRVSNQNSSNPSDIFNFAGGGLLTYSPQVKFINNIVHDVPSSGIFLGLYASDSEAYGNIVYNNGWDAADRGHGHGIYAQNKNGTQKILNNIFFSNLGGYGLHIYGESAAMNNYYIEGNIAFNDQSEIGGFTDARNITVYKNYIYGGQLLAQSNEITEFDLGISINARNYDINVSNNIIAIYSIMIVDWKNVTMQNNKIYSRGPGICLQPDNDTSGYNINNNIYYYYPAYGTNFAINQYNCQPLNPVSNRFASWQARGFDLNGSYIQTSPNYTEVIIQPNYYDSNKANILIYNWNQSNNVSINLSQVLEIGDSFEIKDVQNFYGSALVSGIYYGNNINIPMNSTALINYTGNFSGAFHNLSRSHTSSEFGVFVLRKLNASSTSSNYSNSSDESSSENPGSQAAETDENSSNDSALSPLQNISEINKSEINQDTTFIQDKNTSINESATPANQAYTAKSLIILVSLCILVLLAISIVVILLIKILKQDKANMPSP